MSVISIDPHDELGTEFSGDKFCHAGSATKLPRFVLHRQVDLIQRGLTDAVVSTPPPTPNAFPFNAGSRFTSTAAYC